MQVLKDAPGLLWTIKAHAAKKERILSKGGGHQLLHKAEFAPCAAQNFKEEAHHKLPGRASLQAN